MEAIDIGSRREPLWDCALVDEALTTAELRYNCPVCRGVVMTYDRPWEGDGCNYQNLIVEPDGLIRMYYLAGEMLSGDKTRHTMDNIKVCYAESRDGISWTRPELGIYDFDGDRANNIIVTSDFDGALDNWFVFRDDKPDVAPDEKYKAVYSHSDGGTPTLRCAFSADGIHFRKGYELTRRGYFDSLNTAHWNAALGKYLAYVRGFHDVRGNDWNSGVRDINVMESNDFRVWSAPKPLIYSDGRDYPLYTNVITPYYRAPHVLTGFPTRYVERAAWSDSFDKIPGADARRERAAIHPRYGLTVTDCLFMCSRDGEAWTRSGAAFMRPGSENGLNWVYGDCYPTVGMTEVPSVIPGAEPESAMYTYLGHWSGQPARLLLHTIRRDGFACRAAGDGERTVVTKPFRFNGSRLIVNFSTSARGYAEFELLDRNMYPIAGFSSGETFGDSTERELAFPRELRALSSDRSKNDAGEAVRLRVRLCDAELYSIKFD